jgi:hypothetical protein
MGVVHDAWLAAAISEGGQRVKTVVLVAIVALMYEGPAVLVMIGM